MLNTLNDIQHSEVLNVVDLSEVVFVDLIPRIQLSTDIEALKNTTSSLATGIAQNTTDLTELKLTVSAQSEQITANKEEIQKINTTLRQAVQQSLDDLETGKVDRAGDTMTGSLKVDDLSAAGNLYTDYTAQGVEISDENRADYTAYKKDSIYREIDGGVGFEIRLPQVGGTLARESQLQDTEEWFSSAIDGLREDIRNEAHFRGYVATNAEIQALKADNNDYAYSAESGTVWIYQGNAWTNSGKPVPDQSTPASNSTPLMDGTASAGIAESYARGDHVHPTDTTLAKTIDGEVFYDGIEKKNLLILRLYNSNNELIKTLSIELPQSSGGGGGEGGTIVTIDGIAQETWDADTKVNKVDNKGTNSIVYGSKYLSGGDITFEIVQGSAAANTIAQRDANGRLVCNSPATAAQVANKGYVDDNFLAKKTGLTGEVIITQKPDGTTDYLVYSNENTGGLYMVRRTVNGDVLVPDTPTNPSGAINKNYADNSYVPSITLAAGQNAKAYIVNANGQARMDIVPGEAEQWTLVQRGANGIIYTGEPTEDWHAANKKYVDDNATKLYLHEYVKGEYRAQIITTIAESLPLENIDTAIWIKAKVRDKISSSASQYTWRDCLNISLDRGSTIFYYYISANAIVTNTIDFSGYTETITKL